MIEGLGPAGGRANLPSRSGRGVSVGFFAVALIARTFTIDGTHHEERQANTLHGFCTLVHTFSCFVLRAGGNRESPLSLGIR
jgi:hypothetical protein